MQPLRSCGIKRTEHEFPSFWKWRYIRDIKIRSHARAAARAQAHGNTLHPIATCALTFPTRK